MDILLLFALLSLVSGGIGLALRRIGVGHAALASAACLGLVAASVPASAQEVVHARTGQVTAINPADKTLTLKAVDGTTVVFHDVSTPEPSLSFAKAIRDKTVPVASFNKVGANVAVFYFGFDRLTAVAIKDLGTDTVKRSIGTVAGFDHHQHSLTLKTDTPAAEKVVLTEDTIFDTADGVVRLSDYKPSKGDRLRCMTRPQSETALLVAPQ